MEARATKAKRAERAITRPIEQTNKRRKGRKGISQTSLRDEATGTKNNGQWWSDEAGNGIYTDSAFCELGAMLAGLAYLGILHNCVCIFSLDT